MPGPEQNTPAPEPPPFIGINPESCLSVPFGFVPLATSALAFFQPEIALLLTGSYVFPTDILTRSGMATVAFVTAEFLSGLTVLTVFIGEGSSMGKKE